MITTLSFANNYFMTESMQMDQWFSFDSDQRTRALKRASRAFDNIAYTGDKTDAAQEHEFPRDGDTDIPEDVQIACCEDALQRLLGVDTERELRLVDMFQQSTSTISRTRDKTSPPEHSIAGLASATAFGLLMKYMSDQRDITIVSTT